LALELQERLGLTAIPPYDHFDVMAGAGTAALELLEDVGELDALLVCLSGGGLTAGSAMTMKSLHPNSRVYGVEPEAGDDTKRSLERGERIKIPVPHTIADGQQVEIPGALTFEINRKLISDVLLVSDAQIIEAMRFLFERLKLVVEPSGASAFAALLNHSHLFAGQRVGVTLSGGNINAARFVQLLGGEI
jgi:threo-3-hydroxy-L-aspartate ammonia-lyase